MDILKKKEYYISDENGDTEVTVYTVFPGVQLVYNSVHMEQFELSNTVKGTLIEIHHCKEGRIEQEFEDEFFYLMPGDLSIAIRSEAVQAFHFPLKHYHGITIAINTDIAPKCFSRFLEDVQVQPLNVAKRLCGERNSFIIRGNTVIEHIFSELYSVPEYIKAGYFKVKILELLLILNGITPDENKMPEHSLSISQVKVAKAAAAYLARHMDQHITIAELAQKFNVSDTYLKNSFKGVYGVPVFSYMRIQKMHSAAQLLMHTDRPVGEIAYEFGYANASKFSVAFQDVMGETPGMFRKKHKKINSANGEKFFQ